jgi:quercetin 2,3-dioxygenase
MYNRIVADIKPLGFHWDTEDPFLFCAHHNDDYPAGNDELGPEQSLAGRRLGNDFTLKDGWRMYHGSRIPGFPAHPHRGFETITVVLEGFVDHSDSHGAAGRYGEGDVQWMTAGAGLQHAEMFPLLNKTKRNRLELFQVWLNLPAARKFARPFYKMLWREEVPVIEHRDEKGFTTTIRLIAGSFSGVSAPPPAPDSWAANPENEVNIWLLKMQAGSRFSIPPASVGVSRILYFYSGSSIQIAGVDIAGYHSVKLFAEQEAIIEAGADGGSLLMLQGRSLNEPVEQYGPFVMNTREEIEQAINDYRRTQFGGWPWDSADHVHAATAGRFGRYADGTSEQPE